MALHRPLRGVCCGLALALFTCGRAVPLDPAVDKAIDASAPAEAGSPGETGPAVAVLPPCDEGQWRCLNGTCRLVGGSQGLPSASERWDCEWELVVNEEGLWCCGCPAQWVCRGRLDSTRVPALRACGWECVVVDEQFPHEHRCTRVLGENDTPPGAVHFPLCKCMQYLDGQRVNCTRCMKNSAIGTICLVDLG
jgi:hypothetical protein